jgi:hypothetical protein
MVILNQFRLIQAVLLFMVTAIVATIQFEGTDGKFQWPGVTLGQVANNMLQLSGSLYVQKLFIAGAQVFPRGIVPQQAIAYTNENIAFFTFLQRLNTAKLFRVVTYYHSFTALYFLISCRGSL